VFDVQGLMEDSETKTAALEKVADLEDDLAHAHERIASLEYDVLNRQMEMEQQLSAIRAQRDEMAEAKSVSKFLLISSAITDFATELVSCLPMSSGFSLLSNRFLRLRISTSV